jgi:hypothetical protein
LFHIWGDDICGDDFVDDTPPQLDENEGCPFFPHNDFNACGSDENGEMYMNYMDYVDDDCMNMFTVEQAVRMDAALFGPRASLLNSVACQTSLSVKNENFKTALKIYPNPVENILNVQFNKIVETGNIKLVDMAGKVVMNNTVDNSNIVTLDVSTLGSGIYFLKTETNNIVTTKKFIK